MKRNQKDDFILCLEECRVDKLPSLLWRYSWMPTTSTRTSGWIESPGSQSYWMKRCLLFQQNIHITLTAWVDFRLSNRWHNTSITIWNRQWFPSVQNEDKWTSSREPDCSLSKTMMWVESSANLKLGLSRRSPIRYNWQSKLSTELTNCLFSRSHVFHLIAWEFSMLKQAGEIPQHLVSHPLSHLLHFTSVRCICYTDIQWIQSLIQKQCADLRVDKPV